MHMCLMYAKRICVSGSPVPLYNIACIRSVLLLKASRTPRSLKAEGGNSTHSVLSTKAGRFFEKIDLEQLE